MFNDEINEKMGLNFDEDKKEDIVEDTTTPTTNEETPFDEKDELVEQLSENEYKPIENNHSEEVVKEEATEKVDKEELKEQKRLEKEKAKEEKRLEKESNKEERHKSASATRHLLFTFGWVVIVILSIWFGIEAIKTFVNEFSDFIDKAKTSTDTGESSDGWAATAAFFDSLQYFFEAFLFAFFITFSCKKTISEFIPWRKHRKDTLPARQDKKIAALLEKEQKAIRKCETLAVIVDYQDFNGTDKKKNIKHLEDQVKRYNKLYSAKKANDKKK